MLGLRDAQTRQGFEAIDEVEFDPDQGAHTQLLPASSLVVRYSDYASGECMAWGATPPDYCGFARDDAATAAGRGRQQQQRHCQHEPSPSHDLAGGGGGASASSVPPRPVGADACIAHLEDQGYVVLSNVLTQARVLELRDHLQSALLLASRN